MRKLFQKLNLSLFSFFLLTLIACNGKNDGPPKEDIAAINLKRGDVIACGPADKQFGLVGFETSCSDKVKKDVDLAIALLHSFEYDEAEKVFAKVIDAEPGCAIAYWGVAMSNYHPLWAPPTPEELEKGAKAIAVAQSLTNKTERESAYIDAIGAFYKDWNKTNHVTRCLNFEKAMEKMYADYPNDKEAAIFYALALDGAASPTDTSFMKQRKAGAILTALQPKYPDHPGIVHYIIHSYDYPQLAALALPAAREYASIAPSSAHAQHMPSHIFTRLGLWDEDIQSNLIAAASAKCYGENMGIKGHWDEELHTLDYLVYSYLQKGNNTLAKKQWDYLKTINEVNPMNFKVAYAFASIPSRYLLENKMWNEAAHFEIHPVSLPWKDYPWQKAIIYFAHTLGFAHIGQIDSAKAELKNLTACYNTLVEQKDAYKATQVQIQMKSAEAWILFKEGKNNEALELMKAAVDMEDKTQKHPVTPGEVIPARELLGDMFMAMKHPRQALEMYEADLKKHPNRFNGLYSAGLAAEELKNKEKAKSYYQQLVTISNADSSDRPELKAALSFLKNYNL
jgi:tetratricopeptide (TPR) repeat protein